VPGLQVLGPHSAFATQFTCLTGTKVQILTLRNLQACKLEGIILGAAPAHPLNLIVQKYKY
jgi:hypothetical protein